MSLDINLTGVEKTSNKKTTLTDNSDTFYPTQKAVKTAVDAKFNTPTGTTAQYLRGDGTVATFPTIPSITGLVPYTGATQDVDLGEYELKAGQVEFDQTPTGTAGVAVMRWNDTDGTIDLGLKGGNVTLQLGQEQLVRVVNKTATNINLLEANYQAVRVTGAQGQRLKVDLAQATTDVLSAETIGLVTENINNNQEGFITTSGLVRNINTTGSLQSETWADGDVVYLSPTTAGRITNVKPSAPNHLVIIGYVVSAHATQGSIFVKVDNGYELDELHNVAISTPLNNQSLVYETASTLWKNKALTASDVGAVAINSAITGATKTKITYDSKGLVTSGADATTADIADSSNKRYVTDANLTVIGNTSGTNTGDETQSTILTKLGWFQHNRVAESTAVTGTTAETIIENITIPANTFASGGILRSYNNKFRKVGTAGSLTVKFYIGPNANNLSGATQIATVSSASTNRFVEMLRTFTATTTSLLGWNSTTSTTTDTTVTTADRTETAVTWSVTQNLIITVQLGSGSDSVTLIGASLKNF